MKKLFLTLTCIMMLLLSACGGGNNIEGTWYSLPEINMLQFEASKVTMAGQNVGQYEDAGDYIILSMVDGMTNQILYLTESDGVDVLADVKEGEGTIYLCRGLEEAKQMVANMEQAAREEEEKQANALIDKYTDFLNDNLIGTWETPNPVTLFGPAAEIIEFTPDMKIRMTMTDDSIVELEWTDTTVAFNEGDRLVATLTTAEGEELLLICTEDTFTSYEFYKSGSIFTKVKP